MSDSVVRVPQATAQGTDAKIDNEAVTVAGQTVNRQRNQVTGVAPDDIAVVTDAEPSASDHGLVVRPIPSTTPQPVSGTVAVSNLPATQPVTGAVEVSNFPATQPVSGAVTAAQGAAGSAAWLVDERLGTFGYDSATLTSGTFSPVGRVASFRVFASGADGSFRINSGATIAVRADSGFDWTPRTSLSSPTFAWVSGSLDVFVELAT
jgi:hypothetical protein